jgi:excisionase family DNA binding protein
MSLSDINKAFIRGDGSIGGPDRTGAVTMTTREEPEVLSLAVAADYLGISQRTLRRWIAEKKVPHAKIGGLIRFRRAALREWLEDAERRTMTGQDAPTGSDALLPPLESLSSEERAARVDAMIGALAWVPTSVDDFIRRKQEEIELEDRGRKSRG